MQENNSRKPSHLIITLSIFLIIFLIPFLTIASTLFILPSVYEDTFVGELSAKYDRLTETEDKKIVFVGGSSLAFGLDCDLVKEELDIEPVNLGLYANLGTKIMLDLARANINEGDIIVIAPEMNSQTLSLYFNAETTLQALDGRMDMLAYIDSEDYTSLLGESWNFTGKKLSYLTSDKRPENTGAYKKENFNEYGDNDYDRPYNIMNSISKSITLDFRYDKDDDSVTEYEKFIDYTNDYIRYATNKGATVYFSFPPMNESALADNVSRDFIYDFYTNLRSSLNCRIISNIEDYIMNEGYFYDSEFHLNNSGVTARTITLIDDIKREMGISELTSLTHPIPAPSGFAPIDFEKEDTENLYFEITAAENGGGQPIWNISGLNEEGKKQINLTIPTSVDGVPVTGILANAFDGAEVRTIVIGKNINHIFSKAFSGAKKLEAVYIDKADPAAISVPNIQDENGLITDGGNPNLKIYIPKEGLELYKTDYFWSDYTSYFRTN